MEVKTPRKKISFTDVGDVTPKSSFKQRSVVSDVTFEFRDDSSSHRDNSHSLKGPSSPKKPVPTVSPMKQPLSSEVDGVNGSQEEPAEPIQTHHTTEAKTDVPQTDVPQT